MTRAQELLNRKVQARWWAASMDRRRNQTGIAHVVHNGATLCGAKPFDTGGSFASAAETGCHECRRCRAILDKTATLTTTGRSFMDAERIRSCLSHGLAMFWANQRYECIVDGPRLWVTFDRGQRHENTIALEGNHDPDRFYPSPEQISHIIDTDRDKYPIPARPSLMSRPSRLVKFRNDDKVVWVQVLDAWFKEPPSVEVATELAIDLVEDEGFTAEHVQVVI